MISSIPMSCEWLAYLTSAGVPRPDMISSQFLTLLVYSRVRRFESRDELIHCLFGYFWTMATSRMAICGERDRQKMD